MVPLADITPSRIFCVNIASPENSQNVVSKVQRNSFFHISCAFVCLFLVVENKMGEMCVSGGWEGD